MTLPTLEESPGGLGSLVQGLGVGMQQALPSIQEMILNREKQKQFQQNYPELFSTKKAKTSINPNDQQNVGIQGNQSYENFQNAANRAATMGDYHLAQNFLEQGKVFEKRNAQQQSFANEINKPIFEQVRISSDKIPNQRAALNSAKAAIQDTGYFSASNMASIINNMTDNKFNLPSDVSGTQLLTANKTMLIDTVGKVQAKGLNQFMEKQIDSAQAKIGRSKEANKVPLLMTEASLDMEDQYNKNFSELVHLYSSQGAPLPLDLSQQVAAKTREYADKRLDRLAYDMRANQESAMSDKEKRSLKKVEPGTPLTVEMAGILLDKYKTPQEAEKVAKKLGYSIPNEEIYMGIK